MWAERSTSRLVSVLTSVLISGCMPAAGSPGSPAVVGPGSTSSGGAPEGSDLSVRGLSGSAQLEGGYGTLLQDQITLALEVDGVQVKLTPLAPEVVRLAAPDTWRRLEGLHDRMAPQLPTNSRLFLVSFFTNDEGGALVNPLDVALLQRGRRFQALAVEGLIDSGLGGRLEPRQTQQAVYAFSADIDPRLALDLEFANEITRDGSALQARLETETARVLARQPRSPRT
jgi:hypothetical protein